MGIDGPNPPEQLPENKARLCPETEIARRKSQFLGTLPLELSEMRKIEHFGIVGDITT
jgi:hypothetical protein